MDAVSGWLPGMEKFRRRRLVIEAAVQGARRQGPGDDDEGIRAFLVREITGAGEPLPADWVMETLIERVRAAGVLSHVRVSAGALAALGRKAAEWRRGMVSAVRAAESQEDPPELMVAEPDKAAPVVSVILDTRAGDIIDPRGNRRPGRERLMVFLDQNPEEGQEGISAGVGGCSPADLIGAIPIEDGQPFLEVLQLAAAQNRQLVIEGICGYSDGNWTLELYRPLASGDEHG